MIGYVDTVKKEGSLRAAHAADSSARDVVRTNAQQIAAAGQRGRPGSELRKIVEAASVQWKIDYFRIGDNRAQRPGFGIQEGRSSRDFDGRCGRPKLHLNVSTSRLVYLNLKTLDPGSLESGSLDRGAIDAGSERGNSEIAAFVCSDGYRFVGGHIHHGHAGVRDRGAVRVRDSTDDAT